jgi:heme/copper-type cytochrome/quinol oxidase subunit 3
MHDWIFIASELLIFLAVLTVLFSLVTWAAILFILLKECCEWGLPKIKETKQASVLSLRGLLRIGRRSSPTPYSK